MKLIHQELDDVNKFKHFPDISLTKHIATLSAVLI